MWYAGTMVGYALMEKNGQGLALKSSRDMLNFTASETLFMVSMGMCYFYGWQTYAEPELDGTPIGGDKD